jgi:pyruvyl transferase EpsO
VANLNSTSSILDSLKSSLSVIRCDFDSSARILYIDYPVHLNIGDLLINLGAEQFFKDNCMKIWRRYYLLDVPKSIPGVDDSVVFLMHGGGNFGDIYDLHQSMREDLLARYPRNRFIFLPQTVHFNDIAEERRSLGSMAAHSNARFYGRDVRSFEILKRNGIPDVGMLPDMAHQLWGVIEPSCSPESDEPFYLIRKDRETKGKHASNMVPENVQTVDWDDIVTLGNRCMSRVARRFMRRQSRLQGPFDNSQIWYPVRDRAVRDGIRSVSKHKEVISDRLHAMLLGLLLKRRVLAMDNSYGKVSVYADTWLAGADMLQLHRA